MPTISNKRRLYTATDTQLFSALPQLNAQTMRLINWRDANGIPRSYNFALSAGALTGFTKGESYEVIPINAIEGLPLVNEYNTGGAPGPLVTIPVTEGQTVFTVNGVQFSESSKLYRGGSELTSGWTYANSGGNVTISFTTQDPITSIEASITSTLQYLL